MPMHRWMARAAGGTSQRLKPGLAMMRSRSRRPTPPIPPVYESAAVDMIILPSRRVIPVGVVVVFRVATEAGIDRSGSLPFARRGPTASHVPRHEVALFQAVIAT